MSYRNCAFCLKTDSRPSREDVFAKWIGKEFPGSNAWHAYDYPSNELRFKDRNVGLICKRICERCNNTWMSKLEAQAKPVLLPLMHAKKTTLSHDDQLILARWLTKTACAYDLTAKRKRACFFTAGERHALMDRLLLPQDTGIFTAQYRGSIGNIIALETHVGGTPDSLPKDHHNLLDTHGYAGTFVIGHVALQIFSFRRGKDLIGKTLTIYPAPKWDGAAMQIWPAGTPINWPPRVLLDDAGLRSFAKRWNNMSLLFR